MESTPTENEKISIYLPGAEKSQMEVVLQFLYTGRMKLTKAMITPVRELLEQVLRIDADFKMPPAEDILALQENSKDNNDGNGGSGSDKGHDTSHNSTTSSGDSSRHGSSREPPKKRSGSTTHLSTYAPKNLILSMVQSRRNYFQPISIDRNSHKVKLYLVF